MTREYLGDIDPYDAWIVPLTPDTGYRGNGNPFDGWVVPRDLEPAADAMQTFRSRGGGVVDYTVVEFASTISQRQRHLIAAATMIDEAALHFPVNAGPRRPRHERAFDFEIDTARARFEPITAEQMVGRHYNWSTRLFDLTQGDPDGSSGPQGYADAFWSPPYGLNVPMEEASALFQTINTGLFGGFDQKLIIWRWSTDWSNYFDDGNDWWGSYCWTIEVPWSQRVTAIGASTTD